MIMTCHPMERMLLERCQELGLDDSDTELLRDLLGWNNRDGTIPKSHNGVEPQVSITTDATEKDRMGAQAIIQLVQHIIGDELATAVSINPIQILEQLGLPRISVVWLVCQLHLYEKCPDDIKNEIWDLSLEAPENMYRIVAPTLVMLLGNVVRRS